ncbi:probable nuclease S1 precursor [Cephalotrichum gorgonifer]|uniref:Probable nuclease S1 n=1 Tax=Cephalotrichum gorgonifer TaxID=2041049 RepID=A0AAE8SY47_9PEZI|nr:probable nuclease S1 precursor [Cephalotrichum gorgonifer]
MKASTSILALTALVLPQVAVAWDGFGHITVAYLASHFVSPTTEKYLKHVLGNNTEDYLGSVATWADSFRKTEEGAFSDTFHYIDALDDPPFWCGVDLERDCGETGCVVTALANYTLQSLDPSLSLAQRHQAAKFVIHFVGDLHQPLHNENVEAGGNGIDVLFNGVEIDLHHVWDGSIGTLLVNDGVAGDPYVIAKKWSTQLMVELTTGKYAEEKAGWLEGIDLKDPATTALGWSRDCNSYICTTVLPEGPTAIIGQELSGAYYEKAAPVVELLVAKAGYRLAAWLDLIVDEYRRRKSCRMH